MITINNYTFQFKITYRNSQIKIFLKHNSSLNAYEVTKKKSVQKYSKLKREREREKKPLFSITSHQNFNGNKLTVYVELPLVLHLGILDILHTPMAGEELARILDTRHEREDADGDVVVGAYLRDTLS